MTKFGRVFVAIDFSAGSDEALRQAHHHASSAGAKLAICHVVPNELRSNVLFPHITRVEALGVPMDLAQIAESAAARVLEVTGRTREAFELIVDEGTPYATIMTHAEEWKADLIVVGSHGVSGESTTLLGSVTSKILRYAHSPVLIARGGEGAGPVVAGTDFSDPAFPAVTAAANEARRTGDELVLVHSLDVAWSLTSYPSMAFGGGPTELSVETMMELEAAALEKLNDILKRLDMPGKTQVVRGSAGLALIEVATSLRARLLVVGTIGRTGLRRVLLGSVAETVAAKAPSSVLVVRLHPA